MTLAISLCAGFPIFAQTGGIGYADSPNFTLDTTGLLPQGGGIGYSDSAVFTLNTTGLPTSGGGLGYADSGLFNLNTTGLAASGGGVAYADSADFALNTLIQGFLWTNTANGNWNMTTNWSPNGVPGSNDTAYIINSGNYLVFITANAAVSNLFLGGSSGTQAILMSDFNFVLTGNGIIQAGGAISNSGGTLAGPGNVTTYGTTTWTGGIITNLYFSNNGTMTIGGGGIGNKEIYGGELVNAGTVNWTADTLRLFNGAVISNAPGGIFNAKAAGGQLIESGATPLFVNAGQINVSPGVGQTLTVGTVITFINSGVINAQSGTFVLNSGGTSTGTSSLNILNSTAVLDFAQGTYTLQSGCVVSGVGNFTVAGATLNEFSPINFNGIVNVSSGTLNLMTGAPAALGLLNVNGGFLNAAAPVTVAGNMNFAAGNILGAGGVTANGTLNISGAGTLGYNTTNGILVNNGTATVTSSFNLDYGSLLSNSPSGTITFSPSANMTVSAGGGGANVFANLGQMIVSASTNTVTMSPQFNNSGAGTVALNGGTLTLNGNGTDSSTSAMGIDVAAGATLNVTSSGYTFSPGTTVTGPGNLTVTSGTANFNGAVTVGGTVTVVGTATANCSASMPFNWNNLNLSGALAGTSPVTVGGAMNFIGGHISGPGGVTVGASGTLAMSGSPGLGGGSPLTNGTLINNGSATLVSTLNLDYGSLLSNSPSGTLAITSGVTVTSGGGGPNTLANSGELIYNPPGGSVTFIEPALDNSGAGVVNVNSGSLNLNGGGADTSTSATGIAVASGATFCINGGTFTFNPGTEITGPGNLAISNGTANLDGTIALGGNYIISGGTANFAGIYNIATSLLISGGSAVFTGLGNSVAPTNLSLASGLLGGTVPVTVNGPMTFTQGGIYGTGGVTANGTLTISGSTAAVGGNSTAGTLVNNGVATVSSTFEIDYGSVFSNTPSGTVTFSPAAGIVIISGGGGNNAFVNRGQMIENIPAADSLTIETGFTNSGTNSINSGTVEFQQPYIQTAGLTLLNGNTIDNLNALEILGGMVTGDGTILGSVTNSGTLTPGGPLGKMIIDGSYVQTSAGTLNIGLGGTNAGTNFDLLVVTNTATLAGTLNVFLTNGFTPPTNQVFTFLNAHLRTNTFATLTSTSNALSYSATYTTNSAAIQAGNIAPVITPIANQNIAELQPFSLVASATDPLVPPQTIAWSVPSGPPGLGIGSGNGVINWTPAQTQSPSTNTVVVQVANNGSPPLSATATFTITVYEVNSPPVLPAIGTQTVNAQALLTVVDTATEPNIHSTTTGYALAGPTGAGINSSGVVTWTPTRAQGPSTNLFTVVVTNANPYDATNSSLQATNTFTVIVYAPTLAGISNQTVNPGQTVSLTALATDNDATRTLTFAVTGGPGTIGASSGVYRWRPPIFTAGTTTNVQVTVKDNSTPTLSASQTFTIIVNNLAPIILTPIGYANGQFTMQVSGTTGPDYITQNSADLLLWSNLFTNLSPVMPFQFTDPAAGGQTNPFYRVQATTVP